MSRGVLLAKSGAAAMAFMIGLVLIAYAVGYLVANVGPFWLLFACLLIAVFAITWRGFYCDLKDRAESEQ